MSTYGVLPGDIRGMTPVPGVGDPQLLGFITDAGSEIDVLLAGKGVVVPVQGNDDLIGMIASAIKWGAAGKAEGAPIMSNPYSSSQIINVFMAEYKRLLAVLDALTPAQLYALGVVMVETPPTVLPTRIALGLGTVANARISTPGGHWSDVYPVQNVAPLPEEYP